MLLYLDIFEKKKKCKLANWLPKNEEFTDTQSIYFREINLELVLYSKKGRFHGIF